MTALNELFETTIENTIVKGFLKESKEDWQVFTLKNTQNGKTAELWVEKECDFFEWQDWETGFWPEGKELHQYLNGEFFTEIWGEKFTQHLQTSHEELFPYFH